MKISLVVPVYNEQEEILEVLSRYITDLKEICTRQIGCSYEVIVVNDGSIDKSGRLLQDMANTNRSLRVVNFDMRYGKQAAITAGMEASVGDCVILADVDILNPIGIIRRVVEEYLDGEQIVYAYRERLGTEKVKKKASEFFLKIATRIFGVEGRYVGWPRITLFSRDVADVIVCLPSKNKFLRTMDNWTGYNIKNIVYTSGYNQRQENEYEWEAKQRFKRRGGDTVQRSKVREHTDSLIYAHTFALLTVMLFIGTMCLSIFLNIAFFYHLFSWVVVVFMFMVTVVSYARAALIKCVGVVHERPAEQIYNIRNVIN